ncbi:MAG: hypothetical protein ACI4IS_05935 [Acutalibacteraceae bacterium]
MKKTVAFLLFLLFFIFFLPNQANALEQNKTFESLLNQSNAESLIEQLPQGSKDSLKNIGADTADVYKLSNLSFFDFIKEILAVFAGQATAPLKTIGTVLAIMLLYAVFDSYKDSLKISPTQQVLDTVVTLCITCAIVIPVTSVISSSTSAIKSAGTFMLSYIPIMAVVLIASGRQLAGSSYYASMILAGEGVVQISSNVITPVLNGFLGISVTSAVTPNINLKGVTQLLNKLIKWSLAFIMTVFSAFLTFKSIIATAVDNVSVRAVRFTLSSFIPIVGSALSEAYKTVQSSVNMLKSGIGVLVIIAVGFIFLPVISQCLIWMISLNISKSVGEVLNLTLPCTLIGNVISVISTLFAVITCIMSVFIISTAVILMAGGAS